MTDWRLFEPEGELQAFIAWGDDTWCGVRTQRFIIEYVPDRTDALAWVLSTLTDLRDIIGPDADIQVSAAHVPVMEQLLAMGLGSEAVILMGDPRTALTRLVETCDPPVEAGPGLLIRQLQPDQIEETCRLRARVFTAEPAYCWFGMQPAFLEMTRTQIAEDLASAIPSYRAIMEGDQLVGFFGADVGSDPRWGKVAGLDLVFDVSIRGRGLVKTAYRIMLTDFVRAGVDVFKGGTSQPAVMSLGRLMGRTLRAVALRRNAAFEPRHFASWLPDTFQY